MNGMSARQDSNRSGMVPIVVIAGFSGFAGLGYEIVWTRLLANSFGHEIVAVLGVLAALFGGLALGSLLFGRRIAASARPGIWYAGLEFAIGVWALASIALLPALGGLVPVLTPVDASPLRLWSCAFAVPFLVLLPATLAMGATLPALEAILAPRVRAGCAVGWVYGANTFGAVAGTLATTFWLIPAVGLSRTLASLAMVNLACAIAMAAYRRTATILRVAPGLSPIARPKPSNRLISLFLTGLLGIGYEVIAIRTLSQIMENTVYTFAALLSVYLLGTALGAALHGRFARRGEKGRLDVGLAVAVSLCCVGGTVALGHADDVLNALRGLLASNSMAAVVATELGIAAVVFLLPTVAMGALFTHLAQASRDHDGTLGPALAANTAGAALAPMLFGPLLLPLLGAKLALIFIAIGYAVVAPSWRWLELVPRAAAVAAALALLVSPISLRFVQIPPGGAVEWHRDGTMAAVSVVRDRAGDRHLEVNNHFRMGGTASIRVDASTANRSRR